MDIKAYIQSGIIESYVLGLTSADDTAEVETLQSQFVEVKEAVHAFEQLVETQAFENAVTPPAYVKAKIMAAIKEQASHVPVVKLPSSIETKVSAGVFGLWRIIAAASVILFIVSAGLNFYLYNKYNQKSDAYQALLSQRNTLQANGQILQTSLRQWQKAAEVMGDPQMIVVKLPGAPGKENNLATVYWNTKNQDVYVMANHLPQPSKGKQFQLWALVDGKPVDAGVLDPICQGVCKMKDIPKAQAFAITLENEGGSPAPTMDQLYVLGKV